MVDYFYSFILHVLNLYMPTIRSSSNNFDKPWVTPEFRNLVKQRQRAYMSLQKSLYCKLRNKVQRLAASLRKQYYTKKIATTDLEICRGSPGPQGTPTNIHL